MTTPNPSSGGMQAELEARAMRLSSANLEAATDLKAIFGSATEWVMELGPYRLLLIPFLGEWWFFDTLHGEWRFTGKKIGEACFVFEGGRFHVLDSGAAAVAAPL